MRWPPYRHVFFDCDSTLTSVEGIDALASSSGKEWRINVLTRSAMQGQIDLEEVYARRLETLKPNRGQITALRQIYKKNIVPGAMMLIKALQELGHEVYIISGGLEEPVVEFGAYLGVPRENIRAVSVEYDLLSGEWWQSVDDRPNREERYRDTSEELLTVSDGKAKIVKWLLQEKSGRSILIGDGVSDLLAANEVDLFVGFGGVAERERVRREAPVYVTCNDLAPVLHLAASPGSIEMLKGTRFDELVINGRAAISSGSIIFNDHKLKSRFLEAYHGAY